MDEIKSSQKISLKGLIEKRGKEIHIKREISSLLFLNICNFNGTCNFLVQFKAYTIHHKFSKLILDSLIIACITLRYNKYKIYT